MEYITPETLTNLGITPREDTDSLLAHLNQTLEERVGAEITEALDAPKLQELVDLQDKGSEEEVGQWLQTNVPEFEQIVQDEIDILLGELAENGDAINKASE